MAYPVEFTDEFGEWWDSLNEDEQASVAALVGLLEEVGPTLGYPHTTDIRQSRHGRVRELRVQHAGRPLRVLYAWDTRRVAILLVGSDKTGHGRWYDKFVRRADAIYDRHEASLKTERA